MPITSQSKGNYDWFVYYNGYAVNQMEILSGGYVDPDDNLSKDPLRTRILFNFWQIGGLKENMSVFSNSGIPQYAIEQISAMFEQGTTLWHTAPLGFIPFENWEIGLGAREIPLE